MACEVEEIKNFMPHICFVELKFWKGRFFIQKCKLIKPILKGKDGTICCYPENGNIWHIFQIIILKQPVLPIWSFL